MAGDFDDFDDAQSLGDSPAEDDVKGKGRKGRGKGGGRKKDPPTATDKADKICFACDKKRRPHSRFCLSHHKDVEAMRYQAKKASRGADLEAALADRAKCQLALRDFAKANPEGCWRKKPIDWSMFKRQFGSRAEGRNRQEEDRLKTLFQT